jgi:hypothetical protein
MPLEVHEIGITMRVGDVTADVRHPGQSAEQDRLERDRREDLIEECVRRVLDVLRAERER